MSYHPPSHGAAGCPCEDCLGARIRLTAAIAACGRDLTSLRQRLDGFKVPVLEALRTAS